MEDLMICKAVGLCAVVLVTLCGLAIIFHFVWWRPKRLEMKLRQQGLRGTSYRFLYGDMVDMNKLMAQSWSKPMALHHGIAQRLNPFIFNMVQTHGRISLSWNQRRARVTVADAKLTRQILEDKHGNFRKPPQNPLIDLLTMGVSNLEGQVWSNRRKLINPAFHHDKLHGMFPAFLTCGSNLVNKWKELMGSQEWYELDVMPQMQIFSSDVIARAAFGSSYEQGKRIFELQKEQVVLVIEAAQSLYLPGFSYLPTKKNKRRYEIDNEIKSLLRDMIEQKKMAMAIQDCKMGGEDLLSLLLQCKDEAGRELSIEDVIEECKLFYFAGQETTANWLTWTLILLSIHPNWQEKARDEVLKICGNKTPALQSLNQLKIVSMILNEVLRLYPPATTLFRYTLKTTNLGSISVPPGVELYMPIILLHHDTEYWGDDADEFNPERFGRGVSNATAKQEMAFYTFGWGPRFCLGQSFAVMEAKLALAMILQNFWFELSPSYAHAPYTIITLQPQFGAPLILHRI